MQIFVQFVDKMYVGQMVFGQRTWIHPAAILSHLLQFISDLEIFQLATINEGTNI